MPTVHLKTLLCATAAMIFVGATCAAQEATRTQDRGQTGQSEQLTKYFVDKLMLANKAEIELAQIAEKQSDAPQIKQLAQTLIEDHQKLNEQLKQLSPEAAADFAAGEQPRGTDRPQQTRTAAVGDEHSTLTKLCAINHEACKNHLEMSKKMLGHYQGQDFNMAFLGMQIGQHTWLLSELKALQNVGSSDFQQVVAEATQTVEQHLAKAKELSHKFEDDQRAPAAGQN